MKPCVNEVIKAESKRKYKRKILSYKFRLPNVCIVEGQQGSLVDTRQR